MSAPRTLRPSEINPRTGRMWTYAWIYPRGREPKTKKRARPAQGELRLDPALKSPRKVIRR